MRKSNLLKEYLNKLKNLDLILILSTLILIAIGILVLFSLTFNSKLNQDLLWNKQLIYSLISFVVMIGIACLDFNKIKKYALIFYGFSLGLLVVVLFYSKAIRNVHSWLSVAGLSFQPSEVAKISTILLLASYLASKSNRIKEFNYLILPFIIILIPSFLILKQPDLGTALVFLPFMFIMIYVTGADKTLICGLLIAGILAITITLLGAFIEIKLKHRVELNTFTFLNYYKWKVLIGLILIVFVISILSKLFKEAISSLKTTLVYFLSLATGVTSALFVFNFLKDYQKKRLLVFIDPSIDPLGYGYNIIQSKAAIGSGKLFGKGFLSATQTRLGFLPEQQADFIFSVIGEEFGLIGLLIVLFLFGVIIFRGLYLTCLAKNDFEFLVGIGVISLIAVQMIINVGVSTGIIPATGLPLPFVSYGGSSLFVFMMGIGLLLGIKNQKSLE
ncbi:MAG: rod shape-determining protein RodA [bacterium]